MRSRVVAGGIGSLGWRQVTIRWTDNTVRSHVGGVGVRAGVGCPPPEGNQEAGIVGGACQVNKYVKIGDIS